MSGFVIHQVPLSLAVSAHRLHARLAKDDENLRPRTSEEVLQMAQEGHLYGARADKSDDFVAVCYVASEEGASEWEFGGLATHPSVRRQGLGTILARFSIAHTLVYATPWTSGCDIIGHVREGNPKPRSLLSEMGFRFVERKVYTGADIPEGMTPNANGEVVGDKFMFPPEGAAGLHKWLCEFPGLTRAGEQVRFELGSYFSMDDFKSALKDLAGIPEEQ